MEWTDQGVILAVRAHGETSAIVDILTREHGRYPGLVKSGRSRRMRPVLQAGNRVTVTWRARLEEHLGQFALEPVSMQAASLMDNPFRLAGLTTITGWSQVLPEREPHPRLFDALISVLDLLEQDDIWPAMLVRWEMGLLDELGFGLDLTKCAATGTRDHLTYVSPKSGRAVSEQAGKPYDAKLLRLPGFLLGRQSGEIDAHAIGNGFRLTGYFLHRHVVEPRGFIEPQGRQRILRTIAAT